MRRTFLGIISIAVLAAVSFLACNNGSNYNENANANSNRGVNANTNANANANMSPTPTAGTREEYESNRERYEREAKESGRKVGTGANDLWLWVKTRFELAAADDLRDSTINVDVDNEVVTLTGTVATAAQRARAETVTKSVEGVKSVRNQLKVAPSGNANTNKKGK